MHSAMTRKMQLRTLVLEIIDALVDEHDVEDPERECRKGKRAVERIERLVLFGLESAVHGAGVLAQEHSNGVSRRLPAKWLTMLRG